MAWRLHTSPHAIRSIVFDLDGTLYVAPGLAREIERAAEELVSTSRGVTVAEGRGLIRAARRRLTEILEEEPTLTRTCLELGIEVDELHRVFQAKVHPERHLAADPVLGALLDSLRARCELYIYTNNNRNLTDRIMRLIGIEGLFAEIFTVEDFWRAKPDRLALAKLLAAIGAEPVECLFVGDRYDVDLKLPEEHGSRTFLTRSVDELLTLEKLITKGEWEND